MRFKPMSAGLTSPSRLTSSTIPAQCCSTSMFKWCVRHGTNAVSENFVNVATEINWTFMSVTKECRRPTESESETLRQKKKKTFFRSCLALDKGKENYAGSWEGKHCAYSANQMRTITLEVFLLFLVHPKGSLTDGTKELFSLTSTFLKLSWTKKGSCWKKMFGMKLAWQFYSLAMNNKQQ